VQWAVWLSRGRSTRAQQAERLRRIGALTGTSADDPDAQVRLQAFVQGLRELDWIDGATSGSTRAVPLARCFHDLALEFATYSYDVAPSGFPRIARW